MSVDLGAINNIGFTTQRKLLKTSTNILIIFATVSGNIKYKTSTDDGITWDISWIDTGITPTDFFDVYLDSNNDILIGYKAISGSNWQIKYVKLTYSEGTWTVGTPVIIESQSAISLIETYPSITKRSNGDIYIAIYRRGDKSLRVYHSSDGTSWTDISISLTILGYPHIILMPKGSNIWLFSDVGGYLQVREYDTSWNTPTTIFDDSVYENENLHSVIKIDDNNIYVAFYQNNDTDGGFLIFKWNGSSWDGGTSLTSGWFQDTFGKLININSLPVFIFIKENHPIYTIKYSKYDGSSWGELTLIYTFTGYNYEFLTAKETDTNTIYIGYTDNSHSHLYFEKISFVSPSVQETIISDVYFKGTGIQKIITSDVKFVNIIDQEKQISTWFSTLFGVKINTDIRTRKETDAKINTDLRFIKKEYVDISQIPLARIDFHVEIDTIPLTDNDLKLDSIKITHTIDNKDTAEFILTRKHDDINNPTIITNNNIVTIYLDTKLEFAGRIQGLDCDSEAETVHVYCESDNINEDYNIITKDLPLSSLNEQLHLYDILLNSINIDKPSLDTRLIIISEKGLYWTGSSWDNKLNVALTFATFALAQSYLETNTNDNFIKGNPSIDNYERNPKYYKGIKVDLGTKITERVIRYDLSHAWVEDLEDGTFKFLPNYTYFWTVHVELFDIWVGGGSKVFYNKYIGTSLAPLSADLYEIVGAHYKHQRILDDDEEELGEYTIGEAPYKDVSVKNGIRIVYPRWEDQEAGLYLVKGISYNYEQYCKNVAAIELERIKNINGDLALKTSANIDLTIDGYLYYALKLLTRINVVNTTNNSNIYKNTNGFPVSIKQITIDSSTMKVNINCDNEKSNWELERLYPYPEEPIEDPGWSTLYAHKFDLPNEEEIDE